MASEVFVAMDSDKSGGLDIYEGMELYIGATETGYAPPDFFDWFSNMDILHNIFSWINSKKTNFIILIGCWLPTVKLHPLTERRLICVWQ